MNAVTFSSEQDQLALLHFSSQRVTLLLDLYLIYLPSCLVIFSLESDSGAYGLVTTCIGILLSHSLRLT